MAKQYLDRVFDYILYSDKESPLCGFLYSGKINAMLTIMSVSELIGKKSEVSLWFS